MKEAKLMIVHTNKGFVLIKYTPNNNPLISTAWYEPIDENEEWDAVYAIAENTLVFLPEQKYKVTDTIATKIVIRPFADNGDMELDFQNTIINYLADVFKYNIKVIGID